MSACLFNGCDSKMTGMWVGMEGIVASNYTFFNHRACEFYPCHDMPAEQLNCLFCFCPLYALGERCGGSFTMIEGRDGAPVKDCSACTLPHRRDNYDYIMRRLGEL